MAVVYYDFAGGKIPNRMIGVGYAIAISYTLSTSGIRCIPEMTIGAMLPLISLFALFHIHALGGGDLKLLSVLGVLFGVRIAGLIVDAFIIGACQSLIRLMLNHPFFQRFHMQKGHTIHFSLAVFLAALYKMIV